MVGGGAQGTIGVGVRGREKAAWRFHIFAELNPNSIDLLISY
jgi:hypothetical protein